VPCGPKWLVASGRLQGVTLYPAEQMLFNTFVEVLDWRPAFEVIALACNIGLPDKPVRGGRTCDRQARRLLGHPRRGAIFSAPSRNALKATTYEEAAALNDGMSAPQWAMLRRIAEVDAIIAPYWQRNVYEVHPELSFYQLNDDTPLRYGKHLHRGVAERRALIERRVPMMAGVLDRRVRGARRHHLVDAAACLWTARRIAGRAVNRLPDDPEWDDIGLRMEIVR
jgi:predicted RNase H-like nuclease